ncbi:hypothetical protein H2248_007759 [Termitomyces sp. 'cryptogamus']|nr:hypothetical protein H2248_007759 [Termitomyces sp. 'cryptogamus']
MAVDVGVCILLASCRHLIKVRYRSFNVFGFRLSCSRLSPLVFLAFASRVWRHLMLMKVLCRQGLSVAVKRVPTLPNADCVFYTVCRATLFVYVSRIPLHKQITKLSSVKLFFIY